MEPLGGSASRNGLKPSALEGNEAQECGTTAGTYFSKSTWTNMLQTLLNGNTVADKISLQDVSSSVQNFHVPGKC